MEEYSSTPLFTVGQEIGNFLLSCGILSKAWEESDLARNSESFSLTEHEGVAYVAFPSFNKIESFIVKLSEYGEGNIQSNNKVFSDCLRGNDDKPALVHQGALKLFLHIMEKTDFQAKLQIYTDSKQRKLKPITFVGHSLGGAVATLATLWVLEKRLRQSSPFCITFGCPLVGDERLVEAVGRENWGGNFLHVISQHDIVPRMLLAPLGSIAEPLTAILPYWQGKVVDSSIQDACRTLLKNVLQYTYTVAHYGVESRGSEGVIKRSPYKPFGTYMFCSNHGAACIDNSETILMMLHLTMQSQELLSDNIVKDWFSEHIGYGSVLKPVIENSISGKRFAIPDSESSYEMGISLQLEAIGVGTQDDQTRIFFLPIAGDIENHLNKNVTKLTLELSFKKGTMAELELYKDSCEKEYGITYYDSFKSQDMKDIVAGDRRVKLGDFWDEIIEMWENHELPSDFESQNKWINAGNTYRRLVEPLDIAHYYLTNGNGNYLSDGRPNRHKVIQKWMEAKEKTRSSRGQGPRTKRASLTQDSCFWAHVEEAWKDLENLKQGQHESLQNLEKFEEYVTTMEKALSISSDVFLEGSSFMRWWEEWKEFKKNQSPRWSSPLYNVMESESRFRIISDGGGIISEDSVEILLNSRVSVGGRISEVSVWGTSMWFWEIIFGFFKWLSNWTLSMIYTVVGLIPSTGVENTNIPSTGVVNENILSTQEIDCAQLRKRETELIRVQGGMFELEWYKMICDEKGDGYYDTFKNRNDESDISSSNAILRRAELNQFWDEIIGMCESRELPRDFQSRNKWINAGTVYRELAEPLDIAHYYRTCRGSGNYISDGRQKRHEVLEKWLEGRKTNRSSRDQKVRTELPFLTRDSCFWAHVEEALKDLKKGARDQKKENLEKFEGYVTEMINDRKISLDVFMERSSFMKWWQAYKQIQSPEWKLKSPLYKLMESEFWKRSKPFLLLSRRRTSFKRRICGGGFEWDPRRCSEVAGRSSDVIGDGSPDTEKDYGQRFTAGPEIATFRVSCGILSKAWEESRLANSSESYSLNEYEGVAYVAFPSFHNKEAFIVKESKYGEDNIQTDNRVFSVSLKSNDEQPARVHQGALKLFLHIMENTDFQTKLQIYTDPNPKQRKLKPIVFVGHSLGGAVATLATLWVLGKRLRQSSPFCITFGCPLVGDANLVEAIERESWGDNFCHVVSKYDIVPRMLLAPFESTAEPLNALLPYWWGRITNARTDQPDSFIQNAYRTLLQSVRESDTSPYKPFGTYMFCSSHGATCIANSETVLEVLRLTMQSQKTYSDEIVQDCLLEHISYGSVLKDLIQNSIRGTIIVNPNSESCLEMGISLQLEAIGVEAQVQQLMFEMCSRIGDDNQNDQAKLALLSLGSTENNHRIDASNLAVKLSKKNCTRVELEWYKECCEKDDIGGYYDSFKNQYTKKDIDANGRRLKLGDFWDEIIEMWESHALPSDFQSQNKWVNAGMTYSQLVEPLDIAYYYRKSEGKGNYFLDGRPKRHKVLQKWLEEKEKTRKARGQMVRTKLPFLIPDSCFWAHVEEALKDLKQGLHQKKKSLQNFENYVTQIIKDRNISSYVFLERSSFMRWWQEYKQVQSPEWKLNSPLYRIMESKSWKG